MTDAENSPVTREQSIAEVFEWLALRQMSGPTSEWRWAVGRCVDAAETRGARSRDAEVHDLQSQLGLLQVYNEQLAGVVTAAQNYVHTLDPAAYPELVRALFELYGAQEKESLLRPAVTPPAVQNPPVGHVAECNCRSACMGSTFCETCKHDLGCPVHNAAPCRNPASPSWPREPKTR